MAASLGVRVWKVWTAKKADAEWAAEIDGLLEGTSAAEKQEALRMTVRHVRGQSVV